MKVIILAGGGGTRLAPLSTDDNPKQFLSLFNCQPLIISTIKRFLPVVEENDIFVVTGQRYYDKTHKILHDYGFSRVRIVTEPCAKNTAPAVMLAVKYAVDVIGAPKDEVFFVAPSDHAIRPEQEFESTVRRAEIAAKNNGIVILGVKPTCPETGFGYILADKELDLHGKSRVLSFKEKPDRRTAERYVLNGNYYWNAGMYCFTEKVFCEELKKTSPALYFRYELSYKDFISDFENIEKISIDNAIAEKTKNISMLPINFYWSDIGTWKAYYDFCEKDMDGNVFVGKKIEAKNLKNCLVFNCGTKELAVNDIESKIIIQTDKIYVLELDDYIL